MANDNIFDTKTIIENVPTEFTVNYHNDVDSIDDFSYMGHYSGKWDPGAISDYHANPYHRSNDYKYWIPTPGGSTWEDYKEETRAYYSKNGHSKHESAMVAYAHRQQDYQRIKSFNQQDWHFMGIEVVSAWGMESIWGIESDSDEAYIKEIIDDLIYTLLQQKTITINIR